MKRYNRGGILLQAQGQRWTDSEEKKKIWRREQVLLEASPSSVRSSTKAVNDRNQEQRRTRDTHTHILHTSTCTVIYARRHDLCDPCAAHTRTHKHLIRIWTVHFQGRTKWRLPHRKRKEKQEDTEQKVCSATSNIYSGAAVLSKHYASEALRN